MARTKSSAGINSDGTAQPHVLVPPQRSAGRKKSSDDGNSAGGRKKKAKTTPPTSSTSASAAATVPTVPPCPPTNNENACCWSHLGACIFQFQRPVQCQRDGCDRPVHHLCHITWRSLNEHPEIAEWYCPWHDEYASVSTAFCTAASSSANTAIPILPPIHITDKYEERNELDKYALVAKHRNSCTWSDVVPCNLSAVKPRTCVGSDGGGGCDNLAHLDCQQLWETIHGINHSSDDDDSDDDNDEERNNKYMRKRRSLPVYCTDHHPDYAAYRLELENNIEAVAIESVEDLMDGFGIDAELGDSIPIDEAVTDATNGHESEPVLYCDDNEDNDDHNSDSDGNGSDSDGNAGEEIDQHNNYLKEVRAEQNEHYLDYVDSDDEGEEFQLEEDADDDLSRLWMPRGGRPIEGAPQGWAPPFGAPPGWSYVPKYDGPSIEEIDNPGKWNLWSFTESFDKKHRYIAHTTPAGARVVPANDAGERIINGWHFHYNGWKPDTFDEGTYARTGAAKGNMKPTSRRGILDIDRLKAHGLTKEIAWNDPMFFWQLLFPIADPSVSGVANDTRIPYISHATACTNGYSGYEGGGSDAAGHKFEQVTEAEMVHWTAVPIRHGAYDGKAGSIYRRWDRDDLRYDTTIAKAMTKTRWTAIKRYFKLNNNGIENDRGEPGYDPCVKYDHVYKCMVNNLNYFTLKADSDASIDETTWGFGGFTGECGGRLLNKPFSKGGQTVMIFDINRRFPRAYEHRHPLHQSTGRVGMTAKGPAEVVRLITQLDGLTVGNEALTLTYNHPSGVKKRNRILQQRQIYTKQPHITGDNFFSSDTIMDFAGEKGYGMTFTCRRDRYPTGLKDYVHHQPGTGQNVKAKAMRFEMPIVAIKQVKASGEKKAYTKTLVSFQSTGSTNILGVNNLPGVSLYVGQKQRGRKNNKRLWGTEMNEARETYLKHYNAIDMADHMIKNAGAKYITFKYWHAPYLHGLALGLVIAYDMYLECVEGFLDKEWKLPKRKIMSFQQFRSLLSGQMLAYNPQLNKYMGDETFRTYKKQTKKQRSSLDSNEQTEQEDVPKEFHEEYEKASTGKWPRCCNSADDMRAHVQSIKKTKGSNRHPCEVCGAATTWRCMLCSKSTALCVFTNRNWNGLQCVTKYHSHEFFGLSRSDYKNVYCRSVDAWKPPLERACERNKNAINRILKKAGTITSSNDAMNNNEDDDDDDGDDNEQE